MYSYIYRCPYIYVYIHIRINNYGQPYRHVKSVAHVHQRALVHFLSRVSMLLYTFQTPLCPPLKHVSDLNGVLIAVGPIFE